MALRWKKNPLPTGLARIACGPQGSTLRDGGVRYATTGYSRAGGWYWVAGWGSGVPHMNTCNELVADETAAKAAAMIYVREYLRHQDSYRD